MKAENNSTFQPGVWYFSLMNIIDPAMVGPYKALLDAAEVIISGGIIAFPTETFYGIGGRFDNEAALERIYEVKKRSAEKAMPLIIGKWEELGLLSGAVPAYTESLLKMFWPGPLTVLLPAKPGLSCLISAGTGKVAVRMPGQSFALLLAGFLNFPFTATSANISGLPPADSADDVIKYFGEGVDLVIDGGKTPGGKASTIIEVWGSHIEVVREGAIPQEKIMNIWNSICRD